MLRPIKHQHLPHHCLGRQQLRILRHIHARMGGIACPPSSRAHHDHHHRLCDRVCPSGVWRCGVVGIGKGRDIKAQLVLRNIMLIRHTHR
ncbi:hypothetical protein C8R42DRAFT_686052 [Lentinula raphanica]|nr:hypothetical protein C8R42DRAFT_686052 [Lentinula raphanica]